MKRKLLIALTAIMTILCCAFGLSACAGPTEGLKYSDILERGSDGHFELVAYSVSMGTATDRDIIIASSYNGKPVTTIAMHAFYKQTIESVTIPDSVKEIGDWAFADCIGLTGIIIGSGVTSIGYRAFYSCGLKDINFKGTKEQWNAIRKGNENGTDTRTIHCTDGDIEAK